jgi:hypothetical protein
MEVDVREYSKHEFTPEEIAARLAWYADWSRRVTEANQDPDSPTLEELMDAARPNWRR